MSRDLKILKKDAKDWFGDFRENQMSICHKSNYDSVQRIISELWKFYETMQDEDKKVEILNMIAQKSKMSSRMVYDMHDTWWSR